MRRSENDIGLVDLGDSSPGCELGELPPADVGMFQTPVRWIEEFISGADQTSWNLVSPVPARVEAFPCLLSSLVGGTAVDVATLSWRV